MSEQDKGFFSELHRRRVFQVAGAYVAIAWLVTEIAGFLLEQAAAPGWTLRLLAIVFIVGFPVAVLLAWVIQHQPDGKWSIDSSEGQGRIILGVVLLGILATAGLAWLLLPRLGDAPRDLTYQPRAHSVAILPIESPGATRHERNVAATLFTALSTGLNQSRELTRVRLRLNQRPDDLIELGRRVRVEWLLDGSLRQVPGGIEIDFRLLDVGQNRVVWRDTVQWDPTRIIETGSHIANSVLGQTGLPPLPLQRFTGTDNREAYDAYLLGGVLRSSGIVEELEAAIPNYEHAIRLDPGYVLAYVELARTLQILESRKGGASEEELQERRSRVKHLAEKALELDDQSADAWSIMGSVAENEVLAVQFFERAIHLDPTHAVSYFRLAFTRDDLQESAQLFRKALEFDPMDANCRFELSKVLWLAGHEADAIAETERAMEREPDDPQAHYILGQRYKWGRGRIDQAIEQFRVGYALDPQTGFANVIAREYANLGAREEAIAWLARVQESSPTKAHGGAVWVEYLVGDRDRAREAAERLNEIYSAERWPLSVLSRLDIEAGQADLAVARLESAFPEFAGLDDAELCSRHDVWAVEYAQALKAAGETERARAILEPCLELQFEDYLPRLVYRYRAWVNALLEHREETLELLNWLVHEGHYRVGSFMDFRLEGDEFDFLRDEPEFRDLVQFIEDDLVKQRERIRERERNGELPPAPGVEM